MRVGSAGRCFLPVLFVFIFLLCLAPVRVLLHLHRLIQTEAEAVPRPGGSQQQPASSPPPRLQYGLLRPLPGIDGPVLLFPVSGKDPEAAVGRYVRALEQVGPGSWGTLPVRVQNLSTLVTHRAFEPYVPYGEGDEDDGCGPPRMLVLANRIGHMRPGDPFPHVRQKLTQFGAVVHVLPIRLDLVLDHDELRVLKRFIVAHYDGLVAIGGADIHPGLYGDDDDDGGGGGGDGDSGEFKGQESGARSLSSSSSGSSSRPAYFREIDEFEWDLAGDWIHAENGTIFGICRGHQLLGVMHGASLCKDIDTDFPQAIQHTAPSKNQPNSTGERGNETGVHTARNPQGGEDEDSSSSQDQATSSKSSWHDIKLVDHDNALFRAVRKAIFAVNSRHHQAIMRPGCHHAHADGFKDRVKIVAISGDVIEAAELRSGAGFSVQFHPEDMHNTVGDAVMEMMVNMTREWRNARVERDCIR